MGTKVEIDTDEPVIKRLRQEIKEEKPSFLDVQDDVQAGQSKLLSKANSWSAPEKSVKIEPEIEANKPTRAASIATDMVQMPPPSLGMGPVAQGSSQGMGPPGP